MLELRPSCEHCDKPLPPQADARICSFECTFCVECAEGTLQGICPNCGGNFVPRPIRPSHDRRGGNDLAHYPASTQRKHRPVDLDRHRELVAALEHVPPAQR